MLAVISRARALACALACDFELRWFEIALLISLSLSLWLASVSVSVCSARIVGVSLVVLDSVYLSRFVLNVLCI